MVNLRAQPYRTNIFFRLYFLNETLFFLLTGASSALLLLVLAGGRKRTTERSKTAYPWFLGGTAAAVLLFCRWGSRNVLHDYDFSMDEFASWFQARIFAAGHLTASVPARWRFLERPLTPPFIRLDPVRHTWLAQYLPIDPLLRALFLRLGIEHWENPVLALVSVIMVFAVARRLWPGNAGRGIAAASFLALSSQFLLMSMTGYSMPATLAFNLIWLYLYLTPQKWAFVLLPWVGVLALGIHNPLAHALFAAPFLARLWFTKAKGQLVYLGSVYCGGLGVWWIWQKHADPIQGNPGFRHIFGIPDSWHVFLQAMNLALVLSWQTPIMIVLFVLCVVRWRTLDANGLSLLGGIVLTIVFYAFFQLDQGHGWGYRYVYGVLASIALLAGYQIDGLLARRGGVWSVALSVVLTLGAQIPLRCLEAEKAIDPFVQAAAFVKSLPVDLTVISPGIGWYAQDLIRNDPYLRNRPLVVDGRYLPRVKSTIGRAPGRPWVHVLTGAEANLPAGDSRGPAP